MKRCLIVYFTLLLGVLRASPPATLAVTITPPVIPNNYTGAITLNITGLLSPGENVRVEKFLDANSNGVIDAGEVMMESFALTDGQVPLIGGVRNQNVPGDDDGASNSVIQCNVAYPGLNLILSHIAGQYLFRVTDTNSVVRTATAALLIEQQVLPQGVTGRIVSAKDGTPLTNMPVALATQNNNGFGCLSDANGNFTIFSPPGVYSILPVGRGVIGDQGVGVTVASNVISTMNLSSLVTDGTSISGAIVDSVTLAGLPGVFVQAEQGGGGNLFVAGFTGADGTYSLPVISNLWKAKLNGDVGAELGYCRGPNRSVNCDTTTGSVVNVIFPLPKAGALFYGFVSDAHSNALADLQMDANDFNNQYDSQGETRADGSYCVALLAGTNVVQPDNTSLNAAGYISSVFPTFAMTNNQAIRQDFTLQAVTAVLSGFVYDNTGAPVGNASLVVFPVTQTNSTFSLNTTTGPDGSFSVGVFGGQWNLALECNDASSLNLVSPDLTFNVVDGVNQNNIVLTAQTATANIFGVVTNSSGQPVSGLNISASQTVGGTNYLSGCAMTDINGNYSIAVFPGTWSVQFDQGQLSEDGYVVSNSMVTISGSTSVQLNIVLQPVPPFLSQPRLDGGQFEFQVTGFTSANYRIEASTNLLSTGWVPLITNTGNFHFVDSSPTNQFRFYRAVKVP